LLTIWLQVSFTAEFTDLPADAFAAESFQVALGAVFQQQVSELGDYSFSTSEVSINLSQTEASIDTNVCRVLGGGSPEVHAAV
jgi:hypothetical protein